jgi:hypothetical protein
MFCVEANPSKQGLLLMFDRITWWVLQPAVVEHEQNKKHPHRCECFCFPVETWGIEPQTSGVRLKIG